MPRLKKPKIVGVNSRLFLEDVKYLKEIAAAEAGSWQTRLRQAVHLGVQAMKRGRVIK
jgi:hypothetical protein